MIPRIDRMGPDDEPAVADLLARAFEEYPVVRFVVGPSAGWDEVRRLVGFFVTARFLRGEPVFGVRAGHELVAAALTSFPAGPASPPALGVRRDELWRTLGADARARYERCGAVWGGLAPPSGRLHLNMLGVPPEGRGRGHARLLLDEVHRLARAIPGSEGVSLTTEDPVNVELYEHVGYRVVGRARIAPDLETWSMFRPHSPE